MNRIEELKEEMKQFAKEGKKEFLFRRLKRNFFLGL